jgi:hypothetical protein
MTPDGPKQVSKLDAAALSRGEYKERERDEEEDIPQEHRRNQRQEEPAVKDTTGGYRYRKQTPKTDTTPAKVKSVSASADNNGEEHPMTLFSARYVSNGVVSNKL